jgi:hypothetical protein
MVAGSVGAVVHSSSWFPPFTSFVFSAKPSSRLYGNKSAFGGCVHVWLLAVGFSPPLQPLPFFTLFFFHGLGSRVSDFLNLGARMIEQRQK